MEVTDYDKGVRAQFANVTDEIRRILPYALSTVAVLIIVAFWRFHRRRAPYAHRFQNAMESFLLLSNVLLLVSACAYTVLSQIGVDSLTSHALFACELTLRASRCPPVHGTAAPPRPAIRMRRQLSLTRARR